MIGWIELYAYRIVHSSFEVVQFHPTPHPCSVIFFFEVAPKGVRPFSAALDPPLILSGGGVRPLSVLTIEQPGVTPNSF